MAYIVHFKGTGYTAPSADNPKGIRVKATGYLTIPGDRPAKTMDIPFSVVDQLRPEFLRLAMCVRMHNDTETCKHGPTYWLGKAVP